MESSGARATKGVSPIRPGFVSICSRAIPPFDSGAEACGRLWLFPIRPPPFCYFRRDCSRRGSAAPASPKIPGRDVDVFGLTTDISDDYPDLEHDTAARLSDGKAGN